MNILYPELENYVYQYCTEFKTPDELIAGKTALYIDQANGSEKMVSIMREKGWISDDSKILAMIADGHEQLKKRIVKRIWDEHRNELSLNICPKCGKIAQTPQARQCRFCLYDWH